jgi:tetratricopeptide (TPR) repeat protein
VAAVIVAAAYFIVPRIAAPQLPTPPVEVTVVPGPPAKSDSTGGAGAVDGKSPNGGQTGGIETRGGDAHPRSTQPPWDGHVLDPDPKLTASAKAAYDQHHFATAIDIYTSVLKAVPGNANVAAALADARHARDRQVQTVKDLLSKGDAFLHEQKYADAIESFQRAVSEDPGNGAAMDRVNAARVAQRNADTVAKQILESDNVQPPAPPRPDDIATLLRQADALLTTGLIDEAIETFNNVLKTHPENADAIAGRGKAMARKGQGKFE